MRLAYETVLADHLRTRSLDPTPLQRSRAFQALSPLDRVVELARWAFELTGEARLGLTAGARAELNAFGLFGRAMLSCPTLLECTRFILRQMWIFQPSPRNAAAMFIQDGDLILTYRHPVRPPHDPNLIVELFFAGGVSHFRELNPRALKRLRLELAYWPEGERGAYEETLGIPVTFGAAESRLILPLAIAEAPLAPSFIPYSEGYLRQCERLLSEMRRSGGLEHQVRRILMLARGPPPSMAAVAARLSMSERTLRRRLDAEGAQFQGIVDDVRNHLAQSYLVDTALSVADIAEILGFHDASTFRRAFTAWNDCTPQAFRTSPSAQPTPRR